MDSIVIQLQTLAETESTPVADVLRRARMVATKLGLDEFNQWINHELHGYPSGIEVPKYRQILGDIRARNPYNGYLMHLILGPKAHSALAMTHCRQSVGELDKVIAASDDGTLRADFSQSQCAAIRKMLDGGDNEWLVPYRRIAATQIASILETVRNTILDWALTLEKENILGDDLRFTSDEKDRAKGSPQIHIQNFQGILGDVTGARVTQTMATQIVEGDLASLEKHLLELGIGAEDVAELRDAIKADPQPESEKELGSGVSSWIGKMVTKAAGGIWDVSAATGANVLSAAIRSYYGL